jgi:hypothetical protein
MKNLQRISILYLTLPFIIFCMGWLRLAIAIPVIAIIIWVLWHLFKQPSTDQPSFHFSRSTFYLLFITGLWVFFSGVGGYAFQNWDHHWRNAVLRDLINYNWPVIYFSPEQGPIKMLVYYVGYWLPSALVGKFLGWDAANFFLFAWTWLGVMLVALHLGSSLQTTPIKAALLVCLFSGMDSLGALLFAKDYPTLWPPVQHLEVWAGALQYSSFTTQLFWVFNQAVPAWLCIVVFVTLSEAKGLQPVDRDSSLTSFAQNDIRSQLVFIWSLCFFFAPLASIGLLPYVLIELFKHTDFKSPLKHLRFDVLAAAGIVFLISYLFFSSNTAAQERGFHLPDLKDFSTFFLLEGGALWLLLAPAKWRDPRWMATGALFFVLPFIKLGSGNDFAMRASIAPLFFLMLLTGETVFNKNTPRLLLAACYLILALGALTPLYEINRSVYRTSRYYFLGGESREVEPSSEPVTHLPQGIAPELEHPAALTADEIQTLKFMDDKLSKNFIANVRQTLYYRYISSH